MPTTKSKTALWSKQARLRKADCEKGGTSFEQFKNWLKYSN